MHLDADEFLSLHFFFFVVQLSHSVPLSLSLSLSFSLLCCVDRWQHAALERAGPADRVAIQQAEGTWDFAFLPGGNVLPCFGAFLECADPPVPALIKLNGRTS